MKLWLSSRPINPCGSSPEDTVNVYAPGGGTPHNKVKVYIPMGGSLRYNV